MWREQGKETRRLGGWRGVVVFWEVTLMQESWRRRLGVEDGGLRVVVEVVGFEGCVSGEVCAMFMVCVG